MAEARSASESFFSSCSTNSGGSSPADAGVDDDVVVVVEEEAVLDGRVVKEFGSSSYRTSPADDDVDVVGVDDVGSTVVVKVDIDEEDVLVLLKVVDFRSNTKSGNDNLLE